MFRHQVEAQFIEFSHLISLMKESFDKHGGAPVRLTLLTRTPVLAIDELGKGRKTDWEIAQILNISEQTAHEYVQNAISKLNAATRAQAVAVAMLSRQILS